MFVQQFYTGCLSEAAYYIESGGMAAIIDPLRDIDAYLQLARDRKTRIAYIFETHFHADFVSGHLDLSQATGAPIIYGPHTQTQFPVHVAKDGERFTLGQVTIEVLHTPGHTLESSCYLLRDEQAQPYALFTGDTLFVGDVGRPDLAQQGSDQTMEELAGLLYESLHQKVLTLPDEVIIYPAHGAGSSCGKNLGPETYSTLGEQKKTNYALKPQAKTAFIKAVTEGLTPPPNYFPVNARINKEGYQSLSAVLESGLRPLPVAEVKQHLQEETILLDTRPAFLFTEGFIPGSVFIGLEGRFAEWAGSLLPFDKPILLVTEPGKEQESIVRLARVGFSAIVGYLEGGYASWVSAGEPIDLIVNVEVDELAMDLPYDANLLIVDVRRETEYANAHLQQAMNLPLHLLTDPGEMASIEDRHNLYIHCAGGYRSVIAASLFKRQGFHNLRNILGGWQAIEQHPFPIVKGEQLLNE
jgi:glyoxylase-like metal-dependent hydrolase (beta-lactamase superfamily II)/rhodanese-related sulfurtransferase